MLYESLGPHTRQIYLSKALIYLLYRVVTDRDTGKQKGFAFVEFFDPQTAESAVRNLNEHDLNGRKLKVNFAANDMDSKIRQGKGVSWHTHCEHSTSPSVAGAAACVMQHGSGACPPASQSSMLLSLEATSCVCVIPKSWSPTCMNACSVHCFN
jgi:hypothetical protein